MRILFGVDGSNHALDAVRFAARLLHPDRDEAALFFAPPHIKAATSDDTAAEIVNRATTAVTEAVFQDARNLLPLPIVSRVHTFTGVHKPQHGLLVVADEWRADLIVVGARGLGRLSRLMMGSVSSSIAQTSKVPVLVVRSESYKPEEPLRVLFAYDGQRPGEHAAEVVNQLSWPSQTQGRVLHVVESLFVGELPGWLETQARTTEIEQMARVWVEGHDKEKQQAGNTLRTAAGHLPSVFRGKEPVLAEGNPAEEILKCIEEDQSHLVVMGARGLGLFARTFLGSTSIKVLNHAPCSVLLIHQLEQP